MRRTRRITIPVLLVLVLLGGCADREDALFEKASLLSEAGDFLPEKVWSRTRAFAFLDGTLDGEAIKVRFRKSRIGWELDSVARDGLWFAVDDFVREYRIEKMRATQEAIASWANWARGAAKDEKEMEAGTGFIDPACLRKCPCALPDHEPYPAARDGWGEKLLYCVERYPAEETGGVSVCVLTVFSRGGDGRVGTDDDFGINVLLTEP